jgi:hypoxanthine-guanine phosphoribosyltransferase
MSNSKFQIQKKKIKFEFFELEFEIKNHFSKNHISVSVLTTPIIFWSMTDRCLKFHLDTLNFNFSYY